MDSAQLRSEWEAGLEQALLASLVGTSAPLHPTNAVSIAVPCEQPLYEAATDDPFAIPLTGEDVYHEQYDDCGGRLDDLDNDRLQSAPLGPPSDPDVDTAARDARSTITDAYRHAFAVVDDSPEYNWAREFILDQSPDVVAQVVTNPVLVPHAVSADFLDTSVEADGHNAGMFDDINSFSGIFVPTFSAGNLIVGITMNQNAFSKGSLCELAFDGEGGKGTTQEQLAAALAGKLGTGTLCTGRYVRDTLNDRLLIISHNTPSTSGPATRTCISYLRVCSPTMLERIDIICNTPLFRKGHILDSVIYCSAGFQSRFCPLCAAPPNAGCRCQLPKYKPAHSLDFSRDVAAMHRYPGEYLGTIHAIGAISYEDDYSSLSTLTRPQYARTSLLTTLRLSGYDNSESRHRELLSLFQSFAVQLSISDRSPARAVMPAVGWMAKEGPQSGAQNPVPEVTNRSPSFRMYDGHEKAGQNGGVGHGLAASHSGGIAFDESRQDGSPKNAQVLLHSDIAASTACCSGSEYGPDSAAASDVSKTDIVLPSINPQPLDELEVAGANCEASNQERRIQKNREAAARSNARRKEKNDALRQGLANANRVAVELQKTETLLRAENVALRRRLGSVRRLGRDEPD
jgi:hypothetical protein